MARGHNPLSDPRCLRHASGKPLLLSRLRSVLQYLCKPSAFIEIQYRCGFTGTLEVRLLWWGFRALKTPERAYSLPTL